MSYTRTIFDDPQGIELPEFLRLGAQVILRGRVPQGSNDFYFSLQSSDSGDSFCLFHFHPKLDKQLVIRNYAIDAWSDDGRERDTPYFPFTRDEIFTIRVLIGKHASQVFVNNSFLLEYDHHGMPDENVQYLELSDGAKYDEVTIKQPVPTPYFGRLLRDVKDGMALRVRGYIDDDAKGFEVNLTLDYDGNAVGFRLNSRPDQEDVVLNAKVNGDWGDEERGFSWFPFKQGQFFDAYFLYYGNAFNIYVNEKFFARYKCKALLEDFEYLNIKGDVVLMDVEFSDSLENEVVKPIPSGLEKNDVISIKGFFHPGGKRFFVNLLYGSSKDDDVALHINPSRDQSNIMLKSRRGDRWEDRETHPLPATMKEEMPFTLDIINKEDTFKVYINGRHLSNFRSKGNVEGIKAIHVGGDAYFHQIRNLGKVNNPFVDQVPNKYLLTGSWLSVIGFPHENASQLAINLQTGNSSDYKDDVVLHYNPRFDEKVTVRNSIQRGEWGKEERDEATFPFIEPKDRFEINVMVMEDCYRVFVNGNRHIDYPFRIPPESFIYLMMTGDCDFLQPEYFY